MNKFSLKMTAGQSVMLATEAARAAMEHVLTLRLGPKLPKSEPYFVTLFRVTIGGTKEESCPTGKIRLFKVDCSAADIYGEVHEAIGWFTLIKESAVPGLYPYTWHVSSWEGNNFILVDEKDPVLVRFENNDFCSFAPRIQAVELLEDSEHENHEIDFSPL